jgi:hypothetical protein
LQELEGFSLLQQPLTSTWVITPLDWIKMHSNPALSCFLGTYTPIRDYQWKSRLSRLFQATMMELMEPLEYIQAYIGDLLCISRNSLEDHLEKLEEVLR